MSYRLSAVFKTRIAECSSAILVINSISATDRLVSPRGIDGVYDILNFMTGDNLFTHQLPRASDECKPYLLEQFPHLATLEMDFAVAELGEMLKTPSGKKELNNLVTGWLSKLISGKYGVKCEETLTVKPVPKGAHQFKNPIAEAAEMMGGPNKVIPIVLPRKKK